MLQIALTRRKYFHSTIRLTLFPQFFNVGWSNHFWSFFILILVAFFSLFFYLFLCNNDTDEAFDVFPVFLVILLLLILFSMSTSLACAELLSAIFESRMMLSTLELSFKNSCRVSSLDYNCLSSSEPYCTHFISSVVFHCSNDFLIKSTMAVSFNNRYYYRMKNTHT